LTLNYIVAKKFVSLITLNRTSHTVLSAPDLPIGYVSLA